MALKPEVSAPAILGLLEKALVDATTTLHQEQTDLLADLQRQLTLLVGRLGKQPTAAVPNCRVKVMLRPRSTDRICPVKRILGSPSNSGVLATRGTA